MSHQDYVQQALAHFTLEQLKQVYVDTAVDLDDQVPDTLENLLKFHSEDWSFKNYTMDSDMRPACSAEDLISYVKLTLEPVNH